jgi:hypothetical protein
MENIMSANNELDSKLMDAKQQPEVSLRVTVQELNIVMASLQELPHRVADPILRKLMQQAQEQLNNGAA